MTRIPRYSLYALLVFSPLARAAVQPWAVTVLHIITLAGLSLFVIHGLLNARPAWIRTPLDIPLCLLLALVAAATVFSVDPSRSLWAFLLLVNYVVIFYLTIHTVRTRSDLRGLAGVILGVSAFLALFGLFKYMGSNPFPWWSYSHQAQAATPCFSATFGNCDHLAGHMEMALGVCLGVMMFGLSRKKTWLLGLLLVFILAALLLSLSRGGWIAAGVGTLFFALCLLRDRYFSRKRLVAGAIMAGVVALVLVFSSTPVVKHLRSLEEGRNLPNLASRIDNTKAALEIVRDNPVLGTGPGTFATVYTRYQPPCSGGRYFYAHNDYVHAISETGLLLVPIIVWMGIALYRRGFKKLGNMSRLVRGATLGSLTGLTALLVHSLGDFNLHMPANAILFTVLAALVVAPLPEEHKVFKTTHEKKNH